MPATTGRGLRSTHVGSGAVPAAKKPTLPVTGNPEADALLVEDPLARMIGIILFHGNQL